MHSRDFKDLTTSENLFHDKWTQDDDYVHNMCSLCMAQVEVVP